MSATLRKRRSSGLRRPERCYRQNHEPRDASGRIRRQAARFRVYATLRSGEVRELTVREAHVAWRVELANLKAGWYEFNNAMDLPANLVVPSRRRNAGIRGVDREQLDIRPAPIEIAGPDQGGPLYRFRTGRFFGRDVSLGELATDAAGRLTVVPAAGVSSARVRGTRPTTFANNELWHDDVADGPVRARVTVGGRTFEAKPGYVVSAPPNYAPGLFGVVTMDDVVRDLFERELGWLQPSSGVSFTRDVWPIFDRLTGLQWVNHGAFVILGHGSPLDARDPDVVGRLADAAPENRAFRDRMFRLFRDPDAQLGARADRRLAPALRRRVQRVRRDGPCRSARHSGDVRGAHRLARRRLPAGLGRCAVAEPARGSPSIRAMRRARPRWPLRLLGGARFTRASNSPGSCGGLSSGPSPTALRWLPRASRRSKTTATS